MTASKTALTRTTRRDLLKGATALAGIGLLPGVELTPLMALVREDLLLTKAQIGNTIIASVAITILARLAIG